MNNIVKTIASEAISKGAEMAFKQSSDHAMEIATQHIADTIVDHTTAVALGRVAEQAFNNSIGHSLAPARIVSTAAKDILFSDKSADEIGKNVENASFKAVAILGIVSTVATGGLAAIPASIAAAYLVAKPVSRIYGSMAWGVAKIFKKS